MEIFFFLFAALLIAISQDEDMSWRKRLVTLLGALTLVVWAVAMIVVEAEPSTSVYLPIQKIVVNGKETHVVIYNDGCILHLDRELAGLDASEFRARIDFYTWHLCAWSMRSPRVRLFPRP